jgi:hypothetical protein
LKTSGRIRETVTLFPQSQNKRESKILKEREKRERERKERESARERERKERERKREREKERGGRLYRVGDSTKLTS